MIKQWDQIQRLLEKTLNKGLFQIWIKPLDAEVNDGRLTILAPNDFVANKVRERLLPSIIEAAAQILGQAPEASVQVRQSARVDAAEPRCPAPPENEFQLGLPDIHKHASRSSVEQIWRFSFDDFVVGPSNQLAFAAAQGICHESLHAHRLFLSSGTGLGKTHLLQAVGKHLFEMSNRSTIKARYLTAEEFASQMIMALRTHSMEDFKKRFREHIDLLLLEDVHFLQNKPKIQDELIATLNALEAKGAKAVFSSSFLPRELKDVEGQLVSRFSSGLLAVIDRPDFDTRVKIISTKAKNTFRAHIENGVAEYLADNLNSDVRQIESCLQNLILKARLLNQMITLELAREVVGDYGTENTAGDLSIDDIIDFVCGSYALSKKQLGSKSRKRQVVMARNTAFFLARKHTDLSLKDIGEQFNRQHSTVLKGIASVESEISKETPTGRQLARTIDMVGKVRNQP